MNLKLFKSDIRHFQISNHIFIFVTEKIDYWALFTLPETLPKILKSSQLPDNQLKAVVAQLVERWLPKPKVAGSSPVYRS